MDDLPNLLFHEPGTQLWHLPMGKVQEAQINRVLPLWRHPQNIIKEGEQHFLFAGFSG
jgi:hypothetical protein